MFRNALNNRVKPDYLVQICQFPPKIWIFGFVCLIFLQKPVFIRFSGFIKNPDPTPTCKVEEGDGDGGAAEGYEQQRVVGQLVQAVIRVLHDVAGVVSELFADGDEVHGDEEGRERHEAERPLPTDGLGVNSIR